MAFDKAKCDQCPLKQYWKREKCWAPVDFVHNAEDKGVLILGEGPSKTDAQLGVPFSDVNGIFVVEQLNAHGVESSDVSWGNIIGCRWPKDDPKTYLARLRATNRRRTKKGQKPYLSPIEACSAHVRQNIDGYKTILPMGSYATKFVYDGNPKLDAVRGGPAQLEEYKVLPTYSPSMVMRNPRFKGIFRSDVGKMLRHHRGELKWSDPEVLFTPDYEQAKAFFEDVKGQPLAYDVETDGVDCLTTDLRCIGIGTVDKVLMIPFVSIDGISRFYPADVEAWMKDLLRDVFTDPEHIKVGHNAGYFDRIVVEQHLGVTPEPLVDTILLHKLASSEHRHGLGFIGSFLTDVPAWKADHTGVVARTDQELHDYCATDVAVTARIVEPLRSAVRARGQNHLYKFDAKIQNICVGMRRMGIRIDEGRRLEHETRHRESSDKWKRILLEQRPDIAPNSPTQVRELFFSEWCLPPKEFTKTGEPSVGADVLRALASSPLVDDEQREYINALRFYRRDEKLLTTYLSKLRPDAGLVRDGYVYPNWNSHGTVTGRLSSSGPNFQNIPHSLRDMFIPPKGCVFVGADYDQLELRFASALAGAQHYLDAFEHKEIDPHNLTGDLMFGSRFWESEGAPETKMGKGKGQFKRMRNLAKTICFASLYGAAAPKIYDLVTSNEDNDGNLLYAHYKLQQIRVLHKRWKDRAPEFAKWWRKTLQGCRNKGYVEEVVMGRRRFFAQEDYNAILNFGVQAGGFAVVAQGMIELVDDHLPFDFNNKIGLVNQLHDAVVFTVPEGKAEETQKIVTEVLTRRVEGLPVEFTAEADIGQSWSEV